MFFVCIKTDCKSMANLEILSGWILLTLTLQNKIFYQIFSLWKLWKRFKWKM